MKRALLTAIVAIALFYASHSFAYRDLPADHLSLAVLVEVQPGGSASGFYVSDGEHVFLATAKHVLFDPQTGRLRGKTAELTSYSPEAEGSKRIKLKINLAALQKDGLIESDSTLDASVVQLSKKQKTTEGQVQNVTQGKYVQWLEGPNEASILTYPFSQLKQFDDVLTGNEVFLSGYPSSIGIKELPQIDYSRPLLRKGIVAGKNRDKNTIIIDCTTYYGNSGGPVAQAEEVGLGRTEFRIIGVIIEFIPFKETWINATHGISHWEVSNSGYSVVVPVDSFTALIKGPEKEEAEQEN